MPIFDEKLKDLLIFENTNDIYINIYMRLAKIISKNIYYYKGFRRVF